MELGMRWSSRRAPSPYLHLDSAACARSSTRVQAAVARHLAAEADRGAYVAELEAEPELLALRSALGGLLGVGPDDVALVEGATAGLALLLSAWPLSAGDVVACAPSEWGKNLSAFRDRGLSVVDLPVGDGGMIDVAALPAFLARQRPALVHVTVAASHRALVQPGAAVVQVCRAAGVPVLCDVAQALGQVRVDDLGADAVYAPGRKWLAGPRGVGVLAVHPSCQVRLAPRWPAPDGLPVARRLEPHEAYVAGRLGLAEAVREYGALGAAEVQAALAEVGRATRTALSDVPGWTVCDADDAPGAVTTLVSSRLSPVEARERLLTEHRIVTTAAGVERAPGEMTRPVLRLSPHVDLTDDDLARLRGALAAL